MSQDWICPLRRRTATGWAELVAADLPTFLGDHAICEQQAALTALQLIAHYPEDVDLCDRMAALASEEVQHFRRVLGILNRRGWPLPPRRPNPWVGRLRSRMETDRVPQLKLDRLLVAALVEARSCERFRVAEAGIRDPEVTSMLRELGEAESRHYQLFVDLAGREVPPEILDARWNFWLDVEDGLARELGQSPTVHG